MAKINYYFDTETSEYIRVDRKASDTIIDWMGVLFLSSGIACLNIIIFNFYFHSPREAKLTHEVKEMHFYFNEVTKKVESLSSALASVEIRDDSIYRKVLGCARLNPYKRQAGLGGYDCYGEVRDKKIECSDLIINLNEQVDKIKRKLYIELLSQDELEKLIETKKDQYAAIPAIQPVSNKELVTIASGFGLRIHPIYKVARMHSGIDFAVKLGTPIYATADGQVSVVDANCDGYGKVIIIDHGFGYVTRYAHLADFRVHVGQKIKRGEQIGSAGNTGVSTAPHLHYEVLLNGEQIDPMHYFFQDFNAGAYEKVIASASIQNQSLGN